MSSNNNSLSKSEYSDKDVNWTVVGVNKKKQNTYKPKSNETPKTISRSSDNTAGRNTTGRDQRSRHQNTNDVYINTKLMRYDTDKCIVHPKVYGYIKNQFEKSSEYDAIRNVMNIGISRIDKMIGIANLFFLAVRRDKISIMERIIDHIESGERKFIVNSYDRKYTPIMQASYNGCDQSIRLLLIWGADINQINCDGEDVFSAAEAGKRAMIERHPSMELLIEPKYQRIIDYMNQWKEDELLEKTKTETETETETETDIVSIVSRETMNRRIDTEIDTYDYTMINPEQDIEIQFTEIMNNCIDDCNIETFKLLIKDINNLVKRGYDQTKIDNIIEENKSYILEEYPDILTFYIHNKC